MHTCDPDCPDLAHVPKKEQSSTHSPSNIRQLLLQKKDKEVNKKKGEAEKKRRNDEVQ